MVATRRTAIELASRVFDSATPSDAELHVLACGLNDVAVRDTLYALAVGEEGGSHTRRCGRYRARTLPDPWRVETLVAAVFSAYARGDGPLAAFPGGGAAQRPGHRMAGMLDTALQSRGMRPEQIRELTGARFPAGQASRGAPAAAAVFGRAG